MKKNNYKCYFCNSAGAAQICKNLNFYKCGNCGLYARYPMPSVSELRLIYSECYSREKIEFDCTNQLSPKEMHRSLGEYIKTNFLLDQKINILDYGSGTGGLLKELTKYNTSSNYAFNGVEYSESARTKASIDLGENVFYAEIPRRKYHLVTMVEVIEHLPKPWEDLKLIFSHMETNSNIIITTPNLGGINALLTGCNWREQNKSFHLVMFNKSFLKKLLVDAGFKKVEFIRFFPIHEQSFIRKIKSRLLQLLGLHGGIFVVAKK